MGCVCRFSGGVFAARGGAEVGGQVLGGAGIFGAEAAIGPASLGRLRWAHDSLSCRPSRASVRYGRGAKHGEAALAVGLVDGCLARSVGETGVDGLERGAHGRLAEAPRPRNEEEVVSGAVGDACVERLGLVHVHASIFAQCREVIGREVDGRKYGDTPFRAFPEALPCRARLVAMPAVSGRWRRACRGRPGRCRR